MGDERDLPPRHRGLELAAQDGHEQASGELPGVAHGVRLRAVRDQGVAAVDHALREVGVVIEGQHDRGIRADGRAHELLQATLGVRIVIGRGGAVQGQVDGVERGRRPYARGDALLEPGAGRRRQRAVRAGRGVDDRAGLPVEAGRLELVQEAADLVIGAVLQHRGTLGQPVCPEGVEGRPLRGEAAGLLGVGDDRHPRSHGCPTGVPIPNPRARRASLES